MLLVITTVVLCIVILSIKRCYKKKASSVDNQVSYSTAKLNTDVTTVHNLSYDVIKMDNSTTKQGDSDGINPYYSIPINKAYSKPREDECDYAQPSQFVQHSDLMEAVKMDTNPSYGVSTGGLGEDVDMNTNPSYGVNMKVGKAAAATNPDTNVQQLSYNATAK